MSLIEPSTEKALLSIVHPLNVKGAPKPVDLDDPPTDRTIGDVNPARSATAPGATGSGRVHGADRSNRFEAI